MFAPHTPRYFGSHLGRGSIHHTHGTEGCSPHCIRVPSLCAFTPVCTWGSARVPCFIHEGRVCTGTLMCTCVYKCSFGISLVYLRVCMSVHVHRQTLSSVHMEVCACVCAQFPGWVCLCAYVIELVVFRHALMCFACVCVWTSSCRQACSCEFFASQLIRYMFMSKCMCSCVGLYA